MIGTLWHIFLAFFRSSILSYGGGPASIPLMQQEIVSRYRWMTTEGFTDALAIGNALPGPIAPKMAAYVGYQVAGAWGATVGIVATVAPTALLMVALAQVLLTYKDSPRLKGMLAVAKPIVVALVLLASVEMMTKKSYPNPWFVVISVAAFAIVYFARVNPAWVILVGLLAGFGFYRWFV